MSINKKVNNENEEVVIIKEESTDNCVMHSSSPLYYTLNKNLEEFEYTNECDKELYKSIRAINK